MRIAEHGLELIGSHHLSHSYKLLVRPHVDDKLRTRLDAPRLAVVGAAQSGDRDRLRRRGSAIHKAIGPYEYGCLELLPDIGPVDDCKKAVPDILVLVRCENSEYDPGIFWCGTLFVETKAPGGRLSKVQERELELIRAAGAEAVVATAASQDYGALARWPPWSIRSAALR